jgi:hypothetical protein
LLDGEAVACDGDGLPVFDRLRYRRQDGRVFLFAFDLIELNGRDMRREPLEVRKRALHAVLRSKAACGHSIQRPLRRPAGGFCFPACLQARLRGHREQAAWFTLSVGAFAGLAEDEEPECARSEARGRGGLG